MKKSQFDQLQAKVKAKGGNLDALGSTLGHEVVAKATKPKKTPQNADNWIGTEDDFQIAVARLLDRTNLQWFHVPNGGKRNAREGAKFKRMGVKAGVPDILITDHTIFDYVGLAIELKVGKNMPSQKQYEFIDRMNRNGWEVVVCHGMKEVADALNAYYALNLYVANN